MTRITTSFGFHSTAAEVAEGVDLSGKRAIVTGASSGIGVETARALASIGADVTLAVRDTDAGERVAADITATTGNRDVAVARLDLADQASVAAFVADWDGPLHVLVNNAGVMAMPEEHTPEGWEMQFATNHLGHFALAVGLHGALAAGAPARVVALSSSAHLRSPVVWDDIHYAYREYEPIGAYGQAKTANALFAVGASERWAGDGITVNAVMPGGDRHQLAAPHRRLEHGHSARAAQDPRAGRRHLRARGHLAGARRRRRALLRRLQRGGARHAPRGPGPHRRGGVRARPANAERLWELSLRAVEPVAA
jgi:NAD(P)-dependent dehydrogenase (short-subunit alcohol dehydrogenase family)